MLDRLSMLLLPMPSASSTLLGIAWSIVFACAYPAAPSTNDARAKRTVDPSKWTLLGGGSKDAEGHNRPMQDQPGSTPIAELEDTPTWEVFFKEYVRKNKPCVLRGHAARMQSAYTKWSDDETLVNTLGGNLPITAEVWKAEDRDGPRQDLKFRKFVKEIYQPKREHELYAVIPLEQVTKAKADFILPEPVRCKEILPQSLTLWMSAGGTTSVLHSDDGENFLMLLDGKKEVMLVHQDHAQHIYAHAAKHRGTSAVHQDSVDHTKFPNFKHVRWIKGVLNKGDTLYIPHSYWHQVNSYGRNLGVNFWWGHRGDYRWWNPHNRSEFDATRFGSKGFMPFDELKGRSPEAMKCTPLDKGETMENANFVDEEQYKKELAQKSFKLAKKRQQRERQSHAEL